MKKILFIIATVMLAISACNKNTYVDGTYTATFNEPKNGWNTILEFTLNEDVISELDYDDFDNDGNRKSLDSAYNAEMQDAGNPKPEYFFPLIEAAIINTTILPDYEPIDVNALQGATEFFENANILMEAALNAALTVNHTVVIVPRPE